MDFSPLPPHFSRKRFWLLNTLLSSPLLSSPLFSSHPNYYYCFVPESLRNPIVLSFSPRLQFFTNGCRFFLALFSSPFVTVHFASSCVLLAFLLCTLASRYLAASLSCFHCFPFYIFRFASFVAAYLPFAYFSYRPGRFCISFYIPLVIFHVLVHGFVTFRPECGLKSEGDFITLYFRECH